MSKKTSTPHNLLLRLNHVCGVLSGALVITSVTLMASLIFISWGLPMLFVSAALGIVSIATSIVLLARTEKPRRGWQGIILGTPSIIAVVIAIDFFNLV